MFKISTGEAPSYLTLINFPKMRQENHTILGTLNEILIYHYQELTLVLNCGIPCLTLVSRLILLQLLKRALTS